jgi:outer membrane receptor protein involved in Fe transport
MALYLAIGAASSAQARDPDAVYTRDAIERSGQRTVAEFLERLPAAGTAPNPLYNGGGNGQHLVDLRELGPERTLVRLDGRRIATTLDGAADLSRIPLAIVERIEVRLGSDGAGAGSNAVAGTIDIVTRAASDGAEARAWSGGYDEGDGAAQSFDATVGAGSERSSVLLTVAYDEQDDVLSADRAIAREPLYGFGGNNVNTGASSTTPQGRFGFGPSGSVRPDGTFGTLTLIPGRTGTSPGDFRPFDLASDGYNVVSSEYLVTPSERTSVFARARHEIVAGVTFELAALYGERRSRQQLAPVPLILGTAGSGTARLATIARDSLYNPFGQTVTRAQFRNDELLRRFEQDVDTLHATADLRGRFGFAGREFDWQLGVASEDAEQRETSSGQLSLDRLRLGVGPSFVDPVTGVPTCGTRTQPIPGCVPVNLLGGPEGFTPAMADYLAVVLSDNARHDRTEWVARVGGDVFEAPAGAIAFALGYTAHRETVSESFDALRATGGTTSPSPLGAVDARFEGDELDARLDIPLLAERPFAQRLDLELAARRATGEQGVPGEREPVAHDESGQPLPPRGDWTITVPTFALRWAPIEALELRAALAEGYRAPSLREAGAAEGVLFGNEFDPCAYSLLPRGPDGRPDPANIVVQRCWQGFGGVAPVPIGYESNNVQHVFRTGGNPGVEPERSRTASLVMSWRSAQPGWDASLGWSRTTVDERIGLSSSPEQVLYGCYVYGRVDDCAYFTRYAFGEPRLFLGTRNVPGEVEIEAWDLAVGHRRETRGGAWRLGADATYLADWRQEDYFFRFRDGGYGVERYDTAPVGTYLDRGNAFHRLRARFTTDWQRGDWGATLVARYFSALDEDCFLPVAFGAPSRCSNPDGTPQFPPGENELDATWYLDAQARWDAPWDARLSLGIRNLLDEDPPVSYATFDGNFAPHYEVPGRFWYLGYTQRF